MSDSGFLLIDKPSGITSHDVISRLRRITGEKRIGHSGTLDPFATGLLIVGVGRAATRELQQFLKMDKTYGAVLFLGATSTTGDRTGTITARVAIPDLIVDSGSQPGMTKILSTLKKFLGTQSQIPPMYSAKKVGGKKLYELARRGQTIERAPVSITISRLDLVSYTYPLLSITASCSSGTYIRTLGEDIGTMLGCGAYVEELNRTSIGPYELKDAAKLDMITNDNWKMLLQDLLV